MSFTITPPTTMATRVRNSGSALFTKPDPVRATEKVWPLAAVGRLAGESPVRVAPGDKTVMLNVTIVVVAGLPHVKVTVPLSIVPGAAAPSTVGSKLTPI